MEQMLPQGVLDGIVNYVKSTVKQHIRITTNDENLYRIMEPVIVNGPATLMMVFNFAALHQYELDSSEEERPAERP